MPVFPKNFFVGAATAAHQVEGNNLHSDYWLMENMPHTSFAEPSGDACDHYKLYQQDIEMMAGAGLNAYRFSIEWARIEPREGRFDAAEIAHYRDVIRCCRKNGLEPVATLHHFTSPAWLIRKGGWEAETTPELFARYARFVAEQLGSELNYICTINEANMGVQIAAISERYTRQMKATAAKTVEGGAAEGQVQMGIDLQKMMENRKLAVMENEQLFGTPQPHVFCSSRTPRGDELVMEAHKKAKVAIKSVAPRIKVGLTLSLHDIQAQPGGEENAAREWWEEFTHYLPAIESDDFLGVQNYTRSRIGANGILPNEAGAETTQMDYEFYPQGLEAVIRRVARKFHGELIVTENGLATADDTRRIAYIDLATQGVARCITDGIPIKGYFYWSLLDNFEWQKGFAMTFGLVAVDRSTMARTPKESLHYLGHLRV